MPQLQNITRGIGFFVAFMLGATGTFLAFMPCVLLLPFSRLKPFRALSNAVSKSVQYWFFSYAAALLQMYCQTEVIVHSDDPNIFQDEGVLLIANHRTRIDWMYFWSYFTLLDMPSSFQIFLKKDLKNVPIIGWCMQVAMFVFLDRGNKEKDLERIQHIISHVLTRVDPMTNLLLFPEGTDLSPSNLGKSHSFSKERHLPILNQVLHPKPTGFATCVELLQGSHRVLHDVTMAYEDIKEGGTVSDTNIYKGIFPKTVHLYVKRYSMDSLPSPVTDRDALHKFLAESFAEKEKLLTEFYSSKAGHAAGDVEGFRTAYRRSSLQVNAMKRWRAVLTVVGYSSLAAWAMHRFPIYRWLAVGQIALFLASPLFNGFDTAQLVLGV